jgi:hypothetical protein
MNFQATAVRTFRDFFQMMMTGAALMVGWNFVGVKMMIVLRALWSAVTRVF